MNQKPVFVINCKAYENATGAALIALARELAEVASIKGVKLILCVPATEIAAVASAVKIPIYAQHVDAVGPGAHTGSITPAMLLAAGAAGTLLNHSEKRIADVDKTVASANAAGLPVILCVQDATEVKIYRNLAVQFIAVEPPELIGGDISVSTARPELISASAKQCADRLLVGAGVKNRSDVEASLALGAHGVLIASGVVRAAKPKDAFLELCSGW